MTADHLLFGGVPMSEVRFSGAPGWRSVTRSRRTNLSAPVFEGVDYEDARIQFSFANTLGSPLGG